MRKNSKNLNIATRKLQRSYCDLFFKLRIITNNINKFTNFYDIKRCDNVDVKNKFEFCFYFEIFYEQNFSFFNIIKMKILIYCYKKKRDYIQKKNENGK